MKNKISVLTLSVVCLSAFINVDADAQRGKRKVSRLSNKAARISTVMQASDYPNSAGANTSTAREITAADCGAGTYFNGASACNACPPKTWSTVGSSTCNQCGEGVSSCDATNGNALTCETGYTLSGITCVVDSGSTPTNPPASGNGFKELREKFALQLAEVNASCGFIEDKLKRAKGLDVVSTVSSGVGTAAAGGAVVTSIMKTNRDDKAAENRDDTEAFNKWHTKVVEEQAKLTDDATKETVLSVAKETTTLAKEIGQKAKFAKDKSGDTTKSEKEIAELDKKIKSVDDKLAVEGLTDEQITALNNEKKGYEDKKVELNQKIENANNSSVEYSANLKAEVAETLKNLAEVDQKKYSENMRSQTDTKTLGLATTALMAGATIGSGVAAGTSFGAAATSDQLAGDVEECNNRIRDLGVISENMSKFEDEAEAQNSEGVQKIQSLTSQIKSSCAFTTKEIETIKNLNIASGIVSSIGTGTGAAGTVTSILSNSDKKTDKERKGLNVATTVLAGVTAGTGATSLTLGAVSLAKLDPIIKKASACKDVLKTNLVDIEYKTDLSDVPYAP